MSLLLSRLALFASLLARDTVPPLARRVLLASIVLATASFRLWQIDAPALDRTTWKEIDYLMISTGYWSGGFDFLRPEIAWPAEPPRVTAMELPLVPYLSAILYALLGFGPLAARLLTLLAALATVVYVYRLATREFGSIVGLGSAAAAAFMGIRHPFGCFQFSDPVVVACSVAAVFHFSEWTRSQRRRDGLVAAVAFSLAVALKLTPLYLLLPLSYVVWRERGVTAQSVRTFVGFVAIAMIVPVAWYAYAYHLTQVSIDVFGIFGGHDKLQTVAMLSDPAWWETMGRRLGNHLLPGRSGVALAGLGLVVWGIARRGGVLAAYLGAILAFFAIVAEGQIDAPYRQLTIIPILAPLLALGIVGAAAAGWMVVDRIGLRVPPALRGLSTLAGVLLLIVAAYVRHGGLVRDVERPEWESRWAVAQEIRPHIRPGDRLVAAGAYSIHVGGNDLSPVIYYYTGLQGWTLSRDWSLDHVADLRLRGARLFVALDMEREPEARPFLRAMKERYPLLWEDPDPGKVTFVLDLHEESGAGVRQGADS